MTAAAKSAAFADPVEVFAARAEVRAYLWSQAEIPDLHETVDKLQADAVRDGLVAAIGQDAVQAMIGQAFAAVREPCVAVEPARDEAPKRGAIPKATLDAADYVVRQNDPDRLRRWLDGRSAEERTAIHAHLEGKQCSARSR